MLTEQEKNEHYFQGFKIVSLFTLGLRLFMFLESNYNINYAFFLMFDLFLIYIYAIIYKKKYILPESFKYFYIVHFTLIFPLHHFITGPNHKSFFMLNQAFVVYLGFCALEGLKIDLTLPYLIFNSFLSTYFLGGFSLYDTIFYHIPPCLFFMSYVHLFNIITMLMETRMTKEQELKILSSKNEIISIASHELRNPLQALTFSIENLKTLNLNEKEKEHVDDIVGTIGLLNSIIENILDFRKLELKKFQILSEKFSLVEVIEKVVDIFYPSALKNGLYLHSMVDTNIPESLIGDQTRISQILSNFCNNAIKFTKKGGIILKAELIKNDPIQIKFSCIDTGIGIEDHDQTRLFTPFVQIDNMSMNNGWGLGLSISAEIVKLMKGNIGVESKKGHGSTFWAQIQFEGSKETIKDSLVPLSSKEKYIVHTKDPFLSQIIKSYLNSMNIENVSTVVEKSTENGIVIVDKTNRELYNSKVYVIGDYIRFPIHLKKLNQNFIQKKVVQEKKYLKINRKVKVLLVEDNKMIHKMEKNLLTNLGLEEIESAFDGEEALGIYKTKSNEIDLIMIDYMMPKMDGLEFVKRVRKDDQKVVIVMLSGKVEEEFQKLCIKEGVNEFLSKPISLSKIVETLNHYFIQEKQ